MCFVPMYFGAKLFSKSKEIDWSNIDTIYSQLHCSDPTEKQSFEMTYQFAAFLQK